MRPITDYEKRLLALLEKFEEVVAKPKLTVDLLFTLDSATWITTHGVRILKCDYRKGDGMYLVTMTKTEYRKYLDLCCKKMGFKVFLDGTVMTHDNIILLSGNHAGSTP